MGEGDKEKWFEVRVCIKSYEIHILISDVKQT